MLPTVRLLNYLLPSFGCNHSYIQQGRIIEKDKLVMSDEYLTYEAILLECRHCGKRKVKRGGDALPILQSMVISPEKRHLYPYAPTVYSRTKYYHFCWNVLFRGRSDTWLGYHSIDRIKGVVK